jgi:diaminopimelate decarboxylase
MKIPYEKPVILKVQNGLMNKYGNSPYYSRNIRTEIDGHDIEGLVSEYGSPLFVFSERALRRKYREIHDAFSTRYPNVLFGWSYKTNYLSAICSILHQEGADAEVVSEMEYEKARLLGVPGENIIFNGPHKSMEALKKAVEEGARIHVDHLDEIIDLEKIAELKGGKIDIGIRLNMDTGIQPLWSRFGFNLESGQAMETVRRITHGGKLRINGLHCHIGTFILDPNAYAVEVAKMAWFSYEILEKYGIKIEYFDIGGGLPSLNNLKGIYLPPDIAIPSIDEYAERITDALHANLRQGDFPKLILEAGRAIVDEAGFLVTTIHATKRLPDGTRAYVIDAGVNTLFTSYWYKFKVEIGHEVHGVNESSIIYGPLCMNIDVIDEGLLLPPLNRGTRLVISPVGAYNVTQWMQFIEYRPAVVLAGENGECDVIREAEDLTDVNRRERIPERLKNISVES